MITNKVICMYSDIHKTWIFRRIQLFSLPDTIARWLQYVSFFIREFLDINSLTHCTVMIIIGNMILQLTFMFQFMPRETFSGAMSSIKAYINRILSTRPDFFGGLAQ